MNEKVLIERIEKVFGKYQRPTSFPGEFVEYWQEHVVKIPLDELELKDICDAVCHIPIKTQGNLDVFRYVLRRALYLAFWKVYEYELSEQDFSRKEDYLKYLDKQEDMFLYGPFPKDDSPFYDDIRVRTAQRCIEWKSQLEEEERELLEDIFWWAFQEDYKNTKEISPFYFTLLLAWEKKIPDCHRLGYSADMSLEHLKQGGRRMMEVHQMAIPEATWLGVVFCIYDLPAKYRDYYNNEYSYKWFEEVGGNWGWWNFKETFTEAEMESLNRELEGFFRK